MNREELYEEYSNQYPLIMGFREVTYEDWLQKQVIDLRTNKPLPPAEGAEQIASDLSLTIGLLEAEIDSLKDAYKSDGLNSREYSSAILSHKTALKILKGNTPPRNQQQPTAEGAEEILDRHLYDYPWQNWSKKNALKAMQEFATLHAQRIADKMVAENLVEFGNMIRDEPNGDIAALAEYFIRTINLKSREK